MRLGIVILATVVIGCGQAPEQSTLYDKARDWQDREAEQAERLDGSINIDAIREYVSTLLIYYEPDQSDYWRTAAEVEANQHHGDCEDLSHYVYIQIREAFEIPDQHLRLTVYEHRGGLHTVVRAGDWYYDPSFMDMGRWHQSEIEPEIEYNLFDIWE